MDFKQQIQQEYEGFLQEVLDNKEVWVLQNDRGMACQNALEYDQRISVLVWSNGVFAESEREGDFADLAAFNLPLIDFITAWLPNMQEEKVICTLNWQSGTGGLEVEPQDLLEHLQLIASDDLKTT